MRHPTDPPCPVTHRRRHLKRPKKVGSRTWISRGAHARHLSTLRTFCAPSRLLSRFLIGALCVCPSLPRVHLRINRKSTHPLSCTTHARHPALSDLASHAETGRRAARAGAPTRERAGGELKARLLPPLEPHRLPIDRRSHSPMPAPRRDAASTADLVPVRTAGLDDAQRGAEGSGDASSCRNRPPNRRNSPTWRRGEDRIDVAVSRNMHLTSNHRLSRPRVAPTHRLHAAPPPILHASPPHIARAPRAPYRSQRERAPLESSDRLFRAASDARSFLASDGPFSSHSTTSTRGYTALDTTLVGGRRFEILDTGDGPWPPDRPYFEARVKWLPDERGTAAATLMAQRLVVR